MLFPGQWIGRQDDQAVGSERVDDDAHPDAQRPLRLHSIDGFGEQHQVGERVVGQVGEDLELGDGRMLAHARQTHRLGARREALVQRTTGKVVFFTFLFLIKKRRKKCTMKLSKSCCFSASADKLIFVWNLNNGQLVQVLRGHTDWVGSLELVSKNILASGSWVREIRLWNWVDGDSKQTLRAHTDWVCSLKMIANNKFASASTDRTIRFWSLS